MEYNPLPCNFGAKVKCETMCGCMLSNAHIISCKILNEDNLQDYKYNTFLNGNINNKANLLKIWRTNLKNREKYLPLDPVK